MIFDYLSENHDLMCDCCWKMFEFISLMFVNVGMFREFELGWLFWSLNEKWENELDDDIDMNLCYNQMFVVDVFLCL